ncbi:hypothetical protein [Umezawaea sp. NPDC059074]|uniref:hypothetical protein n=1 Tax=Umezawaea sp. NPDC059074 TaxID=3346716 RepID=UPI00367B3F91
MDEETSARKWALAQAHACGQLAREAAAAASAWEKLAKEQPAQSHDLDALTIGRVFRHLARRLREMQEEAVGENSHGSTSDTADPAEAGHIGIGAAPALVADLVGGRPDGEAGR